MSLPSVIGIILVTVVTVGGDFASVTLVNNGYDGIVVAINPAVAEDETLINKIRNMFTRASPTLFTATKKRAYFRNINILVPKTWTSGSYQTAVGLTYRKADVIIAPPNPVRGDNPYVLQTGACGEPGTHMHLTPEWVNDTRESVYGPSDKAIVHEWAHLRWGVFDEYATGDHKRHYLDSNNVLQGTRCPLSIRGVNREYVPPYQVLNQTCIINQTTLLPASDTCHFIPGIEQPRGLKTSMMFYSYLSSVIEFCHSDPSDPVNQHNTEADNEQNAKCNLRSTWDVITSTSDFSGGSNPPNPTLTNLAPTFRVVRVAASRRFVLVLDVSGSMSGNRLLMMRQSAGDFISTSLPDGDKVGIVQFHSSANLMMEIRQISSQLDRVAIAAGIPGIAGGSTCIGCGIYAAMNEMERHDANETCGNIIVLTDGEENQPPYVNDVSQLAIQKNCVVNAILFTTTENSALVDLVTATGGQWFFAQDRDLKRLMGSFAVIAANDDGDVRNLVSTILYKQYVFAAGESKAGSVIIDSTVGINTTFKFSYQSQVPTIVLTNPTGCLHYSLSIPLPGTCASHPLANIDTTLKFVEFVIPGRATIGTWNYSITSMYSDTVSVSVTSKTMGNVQPIVVLTRTRSNSNIVLGPVIIEATVTRGDPGLPVLNLTVVAVIETPESTEERLQLLDNGGSPDMVRNDGVYSAMFFNYTSRGRYSIQVEVNGSLSNSGDTTFTSKAPLIFGVRFPNGTVAGNPEAGESQPSTGGTGGGGGFTRVTTGGAIEFAGEVTPPEFDTLAPIQINDLTATQEDPNDVTSGIRLSFTAPGDDMASGRATSYKVCYTFGDPTHLSTNFDGNICHTPPVQPQVANTRESFIIKSPDTTGMTGSIRMAIAVKALDEMGNESPVSNLVILRFFIEPPIPKCPDAPPPSPNSRAPVFSSTPVVITGTNHYNNGTTVTYTCIDGLAFTDGFSQTYSCIFGVWEITSAPVCYGLCPRAPTEGVNGQPPIYSQSPTLGGKYLSGTTAHYNCMEGHTTHVDDGNTLVCFDGSWASDNPPQCWQVCSHAPAITENSGPILYSTEPMTISGGERYRTGTAASYTCAASFSVAVAVANTRTCHDGAWNATTPLCLPECGEAPTTSANGNPPSYNPSHDDMYMLTSYPSETNATYRCTDEFAFPLGVADTLTCYAGVWSATHAPLCEAVCSSAPPPSIHGIQPVYNSQHLVMNDGNKYVAGTTATYTCSTNYALSAGVSDVLTCKHGSWLQHTSPQCVQVCSDPSNETSVSFNPPQTDGTFRNATIATYTCTTGFAFPVGVGETQICLRGVWVGGKPQCQPVCEVAPPTSTHGLPPIYNSQPINNKYRSGSVAMYNCMEGYKLAVNVGNTMSCGNGAWSMNSSPTCLPVCGDPPTPSSNGNQPTLNVAQVQTLGGWHYISGSVATYTCTTNHSFAVGVGSTLTCNAGDWGTDHAPRCLEMCVDAPEHSSHSFPPTYTPSPTTVTHKSGTIALYHCGAGYAVAVGVSNTLTCNDGRWFEPLAPLCPAVCGSPPPSGSSGFDPTYQVPPVTQQPQTYRTGTVATYTCPPTYRFLDEVSGDLICNNGAWNATFSPRCRPGIRCMKCVGETHQECDNSGTFITCQNNQGQCAVEIRTSETGVQTISKYCKQRDACFNDQVQNTHDCRGGGRSTVCRCCCANNKCNIGDSSCTFD